MDRRSPRHDELGRKLCSACREYKELKHFHRQASQPDGYRPYCKACRKAKRTVERRVDPDGMKTCTACFEVKLLEEFHRSKSSSDGRQGYCKPCASYSPEQRAGKLRAKYGISQAEYDELLERQGGRCAICRTDDPGAKANGAFAVDHCHATGHRRGLLCSSCNLMIGHGKDRPEVFLAAAEYLTAASEEILTASH